MTPYHWVGVAVASGGFLSYLPFLLRRRQPWKGSGLVGSLWGVAALSWLPRSGWACFTGLLLATGIAVLISELAEQGLQSHDDPRIVIDEFIGYWVTMAWVPRQWEFLVLGFLAFRVLDVWKLPWVRWSGTLPGGLGIVADDVIAGGMANVVLQMIRWGIN